MQVPVLGTEIAIINIGAAVTGDIGAAVTGGIMTDRFGGETLNYFLAFIIVLCFIIFIICMAAFSGGHPLQPTKNPDPQEQEEKHYTLPFIK